MKITIDKKDYELRRTLRSIILYEAITKKPFAPKSTTDMVFYFYSCLLAVAGSDCGIGLDGFVEWLDKNPGQLGKFSEWLLQVNEVDEQMSSGKKKTKSASKH